MKRVMIVGQPGSGKSTLARALGERTGLPVFHIDLIHWKPGWIERDRNEKTKLCHEVHIQEKWIFEGGHSATWPERLDHCDTLIWLDIPLWIRGWRVFKRTIKEYGKSRIDLPKNCPEKFNPEFYRFIWRTRKSARDNIQKMYDNSPIEKRLVRLTNRAQINNFLQEFAFIKKK